MASNSGSTSAPGSEQPGSASSNPTPSSSTTKTEKPRRQATMIEQAEAAVSSEHDQLSDTERKHMGRDVPMGGNNSISSSSASSKAESTEDVPSKPPPAYGDHFGTMKNEQEGFATKASVAEDGRVNIRINQQNRRLSSLLVPALRHQQDISDHESADLPAVYIPPSLGGEEGVPPPPPMNVVVQVVGSRGDVQPFVALGKVLQDTYGHRVRLATHPNFKDFVTENGLEFFNIGGDPVSLMAFMVKNPGLMPGFDSLRSGDVGKRRKEVGEYLKGCWRSCFESGDGSGPAVTDDTVEDWGGNDSDASNRPFVADCIIANPPSMAHIHCAEKLGIPLHIMFTFPYSPTQAFPHPLANIQASNADPHLTNYVSYTLIDMLTWQGLGDIINGFRQRSLGLEPISLMWAPGMLQRLKVPHTYCWSPALIPKPKDWGKEITISGFYFLNLATNYTPDPELKAFLDAGPPPVYIGFGSIVLDDPNAMTEMIFEAVRTTGQRVLLSKGWGGMGAEDIGIPDGVFMLGNVPHDWLFKYVSCVVHHGGAGTTAAGITAGRPTVVVPFFGDQPFWGAMLARAGAGPDPIPNKELTAEKLADAINFCLKPESQERAQELASKIAKEKGTDVGAQLFHQMLDVDKLRCTLSPRRAAVWRLKRTQVRLSAMAACTLANEGLLDFSDLKLFRPREYETEDGPPEPVSGGATAIVGTISSIMMGVADMPLGRFKAMKGHAEGLKSAVKENSSKDNTSTEGIDPPTPPSTIKTSTSPRTSTSSAVTPMTSGTSTPSTTAPPPPPSSGFNLQESLDKIPDRPALPAHTRSTSMADALNGRLNEIRSRSPSGSRSRSGSQSGIATAMASGKGVSRILGAGFKSPMDFTMALAKGFHNAPKLYGDETVRPVEPVTDIRTGLKVASKEFGYGFYDGVTGLVTQPMAGARKEGAVGFMKGIGKGIGGIALKSSGAIFSIPGYTMKGVYKAVQSRFGLSVQNYIIASRAAQGFAEWQQSSEQERALVVERWHEINQDLKKKKNPDELVKEILDEQCRKSREWKQDIKTGFEQRIRSRSRANTANSSASSPAPFRRSNVENDNSSAKTPDMQQLLQQTSSQSGLLQPPDPRASQEQGSMDTDAEFEEAVRRSVRETSRGNPEEDAAVERAIRASLAELRRQDDLPSRTSSNQPRSTGTTEGHAGAGDDENEEEMKRAIEASMAEAKHQQSLAGNEDAEHQDELRRALKASLEDHRGRQLQEKQPAQLEQNLAGNSTAVASQDDTADTPAPEYSAPQSDSAHLAGTSKAEFEAKQQAQQKGSSGGEKSLQERSEEEVVLEYVKKQSLLEEEHKRSTAGNER